VNWQLLIVGGCVLWAAAHLTGRLWSFLSARAGGSCGGSGCGSCGAAASPPSHASPPTLVTLEVSKSTDQDEAMRGPDPPSAR